MLLCRALELRTECPQISPFFRYTENRFPHYLVCQKSPVAGGRSLYRFISLLDLASLSVLFTLNIFLCRMKIDGHDLVFSDGERGNACMTYIFLVVQCVLNLVLAILCGLNGPEDHAPWALLATWTSTLIWALLLANLVRHHVGAQIRVSEAESASTHPDQSPAVHPCEGDAKCAQCERCRAHWCESCKLHTASTPRIHWLGLDEKAFNGQVWVNLLASCALTGSAIWVTARE